MKSKLFMTLVIGFSFFMLSCNNESSEVSKEHESVETYTEGEEISGVNEGEVIISPYFKDTKLVGTDIHTTVAIESFKEGDYYMSAWIVAPSMPAGYPEYEVEINGLLLGATFKTQTAGWHCLALTDAKNLPATVKLVKGVNSIAVIGKGPEAPMVEFVKLSLNPDLSMIKPGDAPPPIAPGFPGGEPGNTLPGDYPPPLEMALSGDDILSYNVTTKEIIFTGEVSDKLINTIYRRIIMVINDEPLFEDEIRTMYMFDSNAWWGYVVLYVTSDFDETKLKHINPKILFFNSERREPEQGSTHEYDPDKRKKDWDTFIKYLSDTGKIVR